MLSQIKTLTSSKYWTRTGILLADEGETIEVKLWNGKEQLVETLEEGDEVNVTAVEVDKWKDLVSLCSTPSTTVEVCSVQ